MKVFISTDIEGVAGVTAWEETEYGGKGYEAACRQMSLETAAACRAAMEAGYEVVVKDGHGDARNIDPNLLPKGVKLIRGWMVSPYSMMGGLDETYDSVIYIGYHSGAGSSANPLAHTIESPLFHWIKINDRIASEFTLNTLLADQLGVPSVFLSGDKGICREAKAEYPGIKVVATKEGIGNATWNLHPEDAIQLIEKSVKVALCEKTSVRKLEKSYNMKICFKEHQGARNAAWYPGAELIDNHTISFTAEDPFQLDIARMFMTGV